MKDLVTGALLAALMVVLLREAAGIPSPRYEPLGAIFFAVLIPCLVLGFSIALIVRGLRAWRTESATAPVSRLISRDNLRFFATLSTGFAWLLAMQLGTPFAVATFGFVIACAFVLGAPRAPSSLGLTLGVALALSVGMEFLFSRYLDDILP
jgi:hypothetical protein